MSYCTVVVCNCSFGKNTVYGQNTLCIQFCGAVATRPTESGDIGGKQSRPVHEKRCVYIMVGGCISSSNQLTGNNRATVFSCCVTLYVELCDL